MKDLVQRSVAAFCFLSIACSPMQAAREASFCNEGYSCDGECPSPRPCQKISPAAWWLAGSAILGAAAAAGTAEALARKGKTGPVGNKGPRGGRGTTNVGGTGPTGPNGPNTFSHDPGSLTFVFEVEISAITPTPTFNGIFLDKVFPFVSTPDGQIFVGPQSLASGTASITVNQPAYGTLNYGYQIKPDGLNVTIANFFLKTVQVHYTPGLSTRNDTQDGGPGKSSSQFSTTLATSQLILANNSSTIGSGSDIQVSGQYTFGPPISNPTNYTPIIP